MVDFGRVCKKIEPKEMASSRAERQPSYHLNER